MSLSDALNEFPEVDALKDLLVAEDEHEAEQLVRDVGKRLGAANQAASAAKAKTEPQIPVRTPDERVADFVTANRTGSRAVVDPGDFWSALWDRQRPMREAEAAGDNDRPPADDWERFLADRRGAQNDEA